MYCWLVRGWGEEGWEERKGRRFSKLIANYLKTVFEIISKPLCLSIGLRWFFFFFFFLLKKSLVESNLFKPLFSSESNCLTGKNITWLHRIVVWINKSSESPGEWFPGGSDGNVSARNVGYPGSIPGLGRSLGEGNGNPLQYSCLENSMDGGAWWATVHGITESRTQLSDFTTSWWQRAQESSWNVVGSFFSSFHSSVYLLLFSCFVLFCFR